MNRRFLLIGLVFLFAATACRNDGTRGAFATNNLTYPPAFRDTTAKQDYHGLPVSDPYQWLERAEAEAGRTWLAAQEELTRQYFRALRIRKKVYEQVRESYRHESYSAPLARGDFFFVQKRDGNSDYARFYRMEDPYDTRLQEVFDPNRQLSPGTRPAAYHPSTDGRLLAVQLAENNSSWRAVRTLDAASGALFDNQLQWLQGPALAWWGNGFFYGRSPEPPPGRESIAPRPTHEVYYHRIGDAQSDDQLVFANRGAAFVYYQPVVMEKAGLLTLLARQTSAGNALFVKDLNQPEAYFSELVSGFDHRFHPIAVIDRQLLVRTDYNAPNYRLLLLDLRENRNDPRYWRTFVAEKDEVLTGAYPIADKLALIYQQQGLQTLQLYDRRGNFEREVRLPTPGAITEFRGGVEADYAYFTFSALIRPPTVYELDPRSGETTVYRSPKHRFDGARFDLRQVAYESYDGARISMFIVHRRDLALDGAHPTLLVASQGPPNRFAPAGLGLAESFLQNGGVFAIVNVRGNEGFGAGWRAAGRQSKLQAAFDDFQSAADYLIANRYTSPEKLAIYGHGRNALIVAACLIQRPELYRAAVASQGYYDLLRYAEFAADRQRAAEFGLAADPAQFDQLYAYSPLHNAIPNRYPATLLLAGPQSDAPPALHAYKFAASLQANQQGEAPVLLKTAPVSGHDDHYPLSQKAEEAADILSFLYHNLQADLSTRAND